MARKNSKKQSKKLKKHLKRLAAYTAAAAATVATTGDRAVNAGEIVHDILDITVTPQGGEHTHGVHFNLLSGTTNAATYAGSLTYNIYYNTTQGMARLSPANNGYLFGPASSTNVRVRGAFSTADSVYVAYAGALSSAVSNANMAPGAIVPSSYANVYAYLSWSNGQTGFAGISFDLGGSIHYGWAQITREDSRNFTLHGFGYNDTPATASHPTVDTDELLGDLDLDGDVDLNDWVDLRDNIGVDLSNGGTQTELFAAWAQGDLDRNGLNDIRDFSIFREAYDAENGAGAFAAMAAAAAVPEPSSIMLLAAGAAGMGMWRRRRAEQSSAS